MSKEWRNGKDSMSTLGTIGAVIIGNWIYDKLKEWTEN